MVIRGRRGIVGLIVIAGLALILAGCGGSDSGTDTSHRGMVRGTVWVANENGNSLTAIDADTNRAIATLTGIESPHNLQVAPDGKSVWAVSGHELLAIMVDAASYELHGIVPTGKEPAHIVLTPDGRTAYTTNGGEDTVTAIDVQSMQVVATIPVGAYPHGLRPSPDGKYVYVANAKSTTVSVIDTASNTRVGDIEVGQKPVQVAFSPDGKFVYATLNAENALSKIEVATRQVVGKVSVGVGPIQVFVTPDGRSVLVANQGTEAAPSTTVSIVDAAAMTVQATIESGKGAHGVVVDPSGKHAYITNIYGNDVAVIDLGLRKVVATIPVPKAPNGVSFSLTVPTKPAKPEVKLDIPHMDDDEMPTMKH